ncbi:MAG: gliding motility-associated C-terminal domain-containing protein [Ferruginibacter sp.]
MHRLLSLLTYSVTVTNSYGCSDRDSAIVEVIQPFTISASQDTTICAGSKRQLLASGTQNFKWINDTTGLSNTQIYNPIAAPLAPVIYTVVGYDNYNCFTDTEVINMNVEPSPKVNAGPDIQTLTGTEVDLKATGTNDIIEWVWSPSDYLSCSINCTSPTSTPRSEITYTITGKNSYGCTDSDDVVIKLICAQQYVFIPNAFAPNGNVVEDRIFYIDGRGVRNIRYFRIFDRWGNLVFERSNINIADRTKGWDGTWNGSPVPTGTYVYMAELECDTGDIFEKKGTIEVIH